MTPTARLDRGGLAARHIAADAPCNALPAGMIVLTLEGALPVEYLSPGDRVITRDSGAATLRAVRHRRARLPAVAIAPGSLGHMRPGQEVRLPAAQEILVRDWRAAALFGASRALVPVCRLVDGTHIREIGEAAFSLVELRFDRPHILYADGLELAAADPALASA